MPIRFQSYDIGCEPSPSVPAELVIQDGWSTYVLFFAVSKSLDPVTGRLRDLRVAVVECKGCSVSKFGYPNDEGLNEHPLYKYGMDETESSVLEVMDSTWADEVSLQQHTSRKRIWGGRDASWRSSPPIRQRHFMIILKEKTFECIADALAVSLFAKTFEEALGYVQTKLMEH